MSKFLKCDMHLHSIRTQYTKEEFVAKLQETDLDVVCVTDHNVIDLDLLKNIKLSEYQSDFAGFELNVHISKEVQDSLSLVQGNTGFFHAVVWVRKDKAEVSANKLDKLFAEHAKFYEDGEYIEKKCEVKETVLENHKIRSTLSVCIEDFKREFNDIEYYFIAHENKQTDNRNGRSISDYLPNSCTGNNKFKVKLLTHKNVALEGSSGVNESRSMGNNVVIDYLRDSEKVQVSTFRFSDATKLSEIGLKYNWINFEGTFNGMILPLTDYETRIVQSKDSKDNPQKNYNKYLERLEFNMGAKNFVLNFEPGYNAIIGSRGSGKSLLGKILGDEYEENGLKVTEISRYSNGSGGVENTTLKGLYIGQNYFESIFSFDNDFEKIDYIKNIQDKLIKERDYEIQQNIEKFNTILNNLQLLITEYITVEKSIKFSHIATDLQEKSLYTAAQEENPSNYKKILEEVKKFKFDKKDINLFNDEDLFRETNNKIIELNNLQEALSNKFDELTESIDYNVEKFKNNLKIEMMFDQLKLEIINLNRNINVEATEKKENRDRLLKYYGESFRFIFGYNMFVKELEETLSDIKRIAPSEDFTVVAKEYQDTTRPKASEELIYEIQLKGVQEASLSDIFSNYGVNIQELPEQMLTGRIEDIKYNKNKMRGIKSIEQLFNTLFDKIKKDLDVMVADRELEIKLNGRDFKTNLSQGERAQAMLDIIFEKEIKSSTDYIILDQPEDNLDNKTITSDLIEKIRNNKRRIQMFVVSHSAPVVINGDADKVFVCSKDRDDNIQYEYGEINSKAIREDIISVLDGGELNLNMRYYKYEVNKETL